MLREHSRVYSHNGKLQRRHINAHNEFYGRQNNIVNRNNVSVYKLTLDIFDFTSSMFLSFPIHITLVAALAN